MNCKHCGSSAGLARENELSLSESYQLCENLAELNCNLVSLMGGEPLIHKNWYKIACCIKDLGMDLAFVTNGLLIPKFIKQIVDLEPNVIGISLDGTKQTHDSIRRVGSFETVQKALDLLERNNIQITVITTVSKDNFNELPQIYELLSTRKLNWQIQIALPFGNMDPHKIIDKEEYYASAMFIESRRIKNKFKDMPIIGGHCYGSFSHHLSSFKNWSGCTAGVSSLGITSDGSIVGCLSMGNNQFIEGNIRNRSLIDIWENPNSFSYTRQFKYNKLGKNCEKCIYGNKCKGGCSSVSIHFTNHFHNSPYCLRQIEEAQLGFKPTNV